MEESWRKQEHSHPWVKIIAHYEAETVAFLTSLAVDVYNDSLLETLTAWSWPSRSLAHLHSERVISNMSKYQSLDSPSTGYQVPSSTLHYRDPDTYREIDDLPVTCRLMTSSGELQSILLGIEEPDQDGARGLLEAVTN